MEVDFQVADKQMNLLHKVLAEALQEVFSLIHNPLLKLPLLMHYFFLQP
jgi:hypothetical protein